MRLHLRARERVSAASEKSASKKSRSAPSAATAAIVGALGGRELGVSATFTMPTMHLVAAQRAPDVAVLRAPLGGTSAAKELHATVAVPVIEVEEPVVQVVAGCLKAFVDLLHGLISAGWTGGGGGGAGGV